MNKPHSTDLLDNPSRFSTGSGLFFLGLILFALYQPGWVESGLNQVQVILAPLAETLERFVPALR